MKLSNLAQFPADSNTIQQYHMIPTSNIATIKDSIFYKVKDRVFADKIKATLYAQEDCSEIEWNMYPSTFATQKWTQEPQTSLQTLYKMRATQIREQYDYVILMCSGGADSVNMCESFLDNGIKVDEIVGSAPLDGLSNWVTTRDESTENTISETYLAQLPYLKSLHTRYPNVRITVNDYFSTMLNYKSDDWLFSSSDYIHPTTVARYNLEQQPHIRALAEKGVKIGVIYGIDKPNLMLTKDNQCVLLKFSDIACNVPVAPFADAYANVDLVLFYYAAELPDLVCKQAHMVARAIFKPENATVLNLVARLGDLERYSMAQWRTRHSRYERAIVPIIYGHKWMPEFQALKPISPFMSGHDGWFFSNHGQSKALAMMHSDLNNFKNSINHSYLNEPGNGFKIYTNTYFLGLVDNFKNFGK